MKSVCNATKCLCLVLVETVFVKGGMHNMYKEIYLIIIGAAIGFISSIGTTLVSELIKSYGQVKLFYKIVYSKTSRKTWGFHENANELVFEVPLWIELLNTSNTVRVIRDFNIVLYYKAKEIAQMTQINRTEDELYGNEGAYSFIIQPKSIMKYDCHFIIKKSELGENSQFDEIRLRYFDEKGKIHIYQFKKIERCWEPGILERERIWQLVKK